MRERARKIGASLEFTSVPGASTTVELKVPLRSLKTKLILAARQKQFSSRVAVMANSISLFSA
jgi:hypothetical protein